MKFPRRRPRWRLPLLVLVLIGLGAVGGRQYYTQQRSAATPAVAPVAPQTPIGSVDRIVQTTHFTAAQVTDLARRAMGSGFPAAAHGVTRVLFTYVSTGSGDKRLDVYARAYIPDTMGTNVIAMAPDTAGLATSCAASQLPATTNYESQLMAYTTRGFTAVMTDYDNMHDPRAVQPYLVGQLEGQAVLDSIRALKHLPAARSATNFQHITVAGPEQGGHAALWADAVNASYAPDVHLDSVVAWSPILDVAKTWHDNVYSTSTIWFGPTVLASYSSTFSANYNLGNITLAQWQSPLLHDAAGYCSTAGGTPFGTQATKLYSRSFLQDLSSNSGLADSKYASLQENLDANQAGNAPTATPKFIGQGQSDALVQPSQVKAAQSRICSSSQGPLKISSYPANRDSIIQASFNDSVAWINSVAAGSPPASICPKA